MIARGSLRQFTKPAALLRLPKTVGPHWDVAHPGDSILLCDQSANTCRHATKAPCLHSLLLTGTVKSWKSKLNQTFQWSPLFCSLENDGRLKAKATGARWHYLKHTWNANCKAWIHLGCLKWQQGEGRETAVARPSFGSAIPKAGKQWHPNVERCKAFVIGLASIVCTCLHLLVVSCCS